MFKDRMLSTMQICQVEGHHDKMARTKANTQNNTKTRRAPRRNIRLIACKQKQNKNNLTYPAREPNQNKMLDHNKDS